MNRLHLKKMALMAALMNKGYLLDISGTPATLTHALKKPLQGVTVYGASGGVGDETVNLFDKNNIEVVHGYLSYNTDRSSAPGVKYIASSTATDTIYIPCKPNTTYTAYKGTYQGSGALFRLGSSTHIPPTRSSSQGGQGVAGDITDYTAGTIADEIITYTTGASDAYLFFTVGGWMLGDTELSDVLMIVEGSYTAETMPEYEPYGYKIPVLIANKTLNLYTDAPIIYGDDLRVNITAKTAYRGAADISSMQDWEQDFTLAKGSNTVSIDTTVAPSAVDWRYWSSVKTDNVPFWGVSFTGSNTTGTRTGNAVGLAASISTDTTAGTSDFDAVPAFQQVRVNGRFNADGSFTETAVEGIDSAFAVDGSNGDVWVRFRKSYYRKVIDGSDDLREITHLPKEGFSMHPLFRNNCTGTETDYAYIAAYKMGWNEADEKVASISGVLLCQSTYADRNANIASKGLSYSTCLDFTRAKDSNGQYSGMTTVELDFLTTLFMIEFANRSSQAVMGDCTSHNTQVKASVAETGVEHITVSTTDAAKFVVGSVVSLGTSTDRNAVACHSIVNRKKITAIDTTTGIITIDNGGVTFDTTTDTYITTMPYYTGETDSILGHTGTPANNGRHTNKYRGVEDMYGQTWCILSDVIAIGSPSVTYRCDEPTAYATSITGSYAPLSYSLSASNGYVKTLGYDAEYPYINMTAAIGGAASTYYGDHLSTTNGASAREALYGGSLSNNDRSGLYCFHVSNPVSYASWDRAARLSGSGWRG